MCECYKIGGPFIAEDPECPVHGREAQERENEIDQLRRDAARYRFLRDVSTVTWRSFQEQWRMPAAACDSAIDAVMARP